MVYTTTEGKHPKKPPYGSIVVACRKDFRNFKKDNGNRLIEHFQSRIEIIEQSGSLDREIIIQKENLEHVKKLLQEGKEDIAFSIFFRTFPSCLPHRSRNL
ncbi:MAG: hypothetical protein ACFE9C_00060 [Candidatus Hodarchaeota archaeon]